MSLYASNACTFSLLSGGAYAPIDPSVWPGAVTGILTVREAILQGWDFGINSLSSGMENLTMATLKNVNYPGSPPSP